MRFALPVAVALAAATAGPLAARAGDGRLEIHASCVATGCFAGDAPGFPVETQAGRSYVLTGPLAVPDANTLAVNLAPRAVLDLGGFEIAGPTVCTGTPAVCTGTGTGDGIYAQAHATVRNGTVRGMGSDGIAAEVGVTVEDVLVIGNAGDGLVFNFGPDGPEGHLVRSTRLVGNGGRGILTAGGFGGVGSLVTDCVIWGNGSVGAFVSHTQITNTLIARNGGVGASGTGFVLGASTIHFNNGGNTQAQVSGTYLTVGTNVCGTTACP